MTLAGDFAGRSWKIVESFRRVSEDQAAFLSACNQAVGILKKGSNWQLRPISVLAC